MHHLRAARDPHSLKVKELEEEVRRLTMENARVKADLEKMQRRWDRLKEGARRRRKEGTVEEEDETKEMKERSVDG
jgi:molecular chaperone GrpE (heat shock protein)